MPRGNSKITARKRPRVPAESAFASAIGDQHCPTRRMLDRIADKWSVLILLRLIGGPVRFNQMRRDIQGISQKVLSQTLKKLERDGLISRTVFATVPVTVEYALTPLGRTLTALVGNIARWADDNVREVAAAQQRYDAASKRALPSQLRA